MSEPGDAPAQHVVQKPRRRTDQVTVADFTMLVRVDVKPAAVRVFTDAEADDAATYAAEIGGEIVQLPLDPPAGYTTDSRGHLVPVSPSEAASTDDGPASDTD
ncbi:hypothetical protein [Mycolicibacterium tusciae]|uniref:hypothetical protein n=1 Tax=Mycolicibacterium tusciae TaxID=75922 RepID=UPI00024A503A|nr:hypothetical protein [Mycolicibacterium tusciae]